MSEPHPPVGHGTLSGALLPCLLAAWFAMLVGCAASAPKTPKLAQPDQPAPKPVDPSYDWRGLLPAPFGSNLKEVPLALHEVLLFRDQAQGAGSPDDAECYGADTAAPRFVGGTPDEYVLCFKQDRLARIRASVSVQTEQAPEIFATACALWLKNAGLPAPSSAPPSISTCEGQDGAVHFSGRLGEEPSVGPAETPLRIVLDGAPDPKTLSQ